MAGQRAGKSEMIGVLSGNMALNFPMMRQFIGANSYMQLTQSTLVKATEIWGRLYNLTRYDSKNNPGGDYVIDKVPPDHFHRFQEYKEYHNIISFKNGHVIYVGSLDNYEAHEGKEFAVAHLDETARTKKEAVTAVITARLSQTGLMYDKDNPLNLYWVQDKPVPAEQLSSYRRATGQDFQYYTPEEAADMNLESWRPLYVHTSPAVGTVDWLLEMFELNAEGEARTIKEAITQGSSKFYYKVTEERTCVIYPTHFNEKNLPPGYIKARCLTLSEAEILKFVCGYPFSKSGGEYFPKFERSKHVFTWEKNPAAAKHLTFDYNVLPFMTGLIGEMRYALKYLKETTDSKGEPVYHKFDQPTEGARPIQVLQIGVHTELALKIPENTVDDICSHFKALYPAGGDLYLYGDASGKSRIAGLGSYTHFKRIEELLYRYLHNESDRTPRQNMGVMARRDLMNRILEGKIPYIELCIDPSCVELIRDMEFLKLGPDGKHKELVKDEVTGVKYQKLGHTSDALEYLVCEVAKHFTSEQ